MRKDAVALAVAILFMLPGYAVAQTPGVWASDAKISTVRVMGKGGVQAEPDMATIRIGVATESPSVREALSANTAATAKVISELEAASIEKKDLRTADFSVRPQYRENKHKPQTYSVSNTVVVTVRDIAKLGEILTKAVAAGSNQIDGPFFSVSDHGKYMTGARKKAVENAMEKARAYAEAAGMKLGEVLEISEPSVPAPSFAGVNGVMGYAAPVPIEAGEERLEAQIYLVVELKH